MDGLRIQTMVGVLATALRDSPDGVQAFADWLVKGEDSFKPRTVTEARQLGEGVTRKLCPPGRHDLCPACEDPAPEAVLCDGCRHVAVKQATLRLQVKARAK